MTSDGPTRATETARTEWARRPWLAALVRAVALGLPTVVSFLVTWSITRRWPPHEIGLSAWAWWAALFLVATIVLLVVDRGARRLLPLAALFKLSLVFPDEAPSRFSTAMRSGTTRQLQRRVEEIRRHGLEEGAAEAGYASAMLELVAALSVHDRLTRGHCERVRAYTDLVIEELGLPEHDAARLRWAALLHDVGKIHVPTEILTKTSKPTQAEWELLKSHTWQGDRLIEPLKPWFGEWAATIGSHHERWDGGGYPNGLAGEQIQLGARIVAVVDAYDVMTSSRSYKKPVSAVEARAEIARCAGSQFDPRVVRAFLNVGLGRLRFAAGPLAWLTNLPAAHAVGPTIPAVAPVAAPVATGATAVATAAAALATGGFGGMLRPAPAPDLPYVDHLASEELALGELSDPTSTTVTVPDGAVLGSTTTTAAGAPTSTVTGPTAAVQDDATSTTLDDTVLDDTVLDDTVLVAAAPTARPGLHAAAEDAAIVATLAAESESPVAFSIVSAPRHGVITGGPVDDIVAPVDGVASLEVRIQPTANWSGTDALTFSACVEDACDEATITLEFSSRNDAPTISGPTSVAAIAGSPLDGFALTAGDLDHPVAALRASAVGLPPGVTFEERTLSFAGTPSVAGSYEVVVELADPGRSVVTHTILFAVAEPATSAGLAITEVLYDQTDVESPFSTSGTQDEFVEITNVGTEAVDLSGYRLVDFDPTTGVRDGGDLWGVTADRSIDLTLGPDHRGGGSVLAPGQSAVLWIGHPDRQAYTATVAPFGTAYDHEFTLRPFDHAPAGSLEFYDAGNPWGSLGRAGDDLWLVAPDGSIADFVGWNDGGTVEQEFSGHPGGAHWDPIGQAALASAPDGASIALGTTATTNSPACWALSGERPGSACADARTTLDTDSASGGNRRSSAGHRNYA